MKIGFIGAGKVGCSLGKLFSQGGIQVTGYFSRHLESAQAAAAFTETQYYSSIADLLHDSDAIFLTVPDGEISKVYEQLKSYPLEGKQLCHCSGALSSKEAFAGIEEVHATGYSIHPLFPVSSKFETYQELKDAFFCLEGDEKGILEWKQLLEWMHLKVQIIKAESKVLYHAACAISSNLMCALVEESLDILEGCGFARDFAREALAPLIRSNMEHLIADGPVKALTGPIERCDTTTVAKHMKAFQSEKERQMYAAVSKKLIDVAVKKHPETDYTVMKQILEGENESWQK